MRIRSPDVFKALTQTISLIARWGNPEFSVSVERERGECRSYLCGKRAAILKIPTRTRVIGGESLRLRMLALA